VNFDVILTVVLCALTVSILRLSRQVTGALDRLTDRLTEADGTAGALAPVLARVADGLERGIAAIVVEPETDEEE
jgi:hypothetical protein